MRLRVMAKDLQVGDRLVTSKGPRVALLHRSHGGRVLARVTVRGARSPSLRQWAPEEPVHIHRKETTS